MFPGQHEHARAGDLRNRTDFVGGVAPVLCQSQQVAGYWPCEYFLRVK